MALTGIEKATILLSILGADSSAKIIRFLPQDMADALVSGINKLPKASPDSIGKVLVEFREFISLPSAREPRAIEDQKAPSREEPRKTGAKLKPNEFLSSVPGRVLIPALLRERPQTIAFVLNELPDSRVVEVLTYLPEQRREVEYLLHTIKTNPLYDSIKDNVLGSLVKRLS